MMSPTAPDLGSVARMHALHLQEDLFFRQVAYLSMLQVQT
jgi:hypothetical protein